VPVNFLEQSLTPLQPQLLLMQTALLLPQSLLASQPQTPVAVLQKPDAQSEFWPQPQVPLTQAGAPGTRKQSAVEAQADTHSFAVAWHLSEVLSPHTVTLPLPSMFGIENVLGWITQNGAVLRKAHLPIPPPMFTQTLPAAVQSPAAAQSSVQLLASAVQSESTLQMSEKPSSWRQRPN